MGAQRVYIKVLKAPRKDCPEEGHGCEKRGLLQDNVGHVRGAVLQCTLGPPPGPPSRTAQARSPQGATELAAPRERDWRRRDGCGR